MLDIPDFTIDADLQPCVPLLIALRCWLCMLGIGVRDCGCQVKYATHRYWVFKGAGIEADECWPGVGEGCGATEGQLEGLLEEKATEDHEVVSVAVLRLHYLGRVHAGFVHEYYVLRLSDSVVRICKI